MTDKTVAVLLKTVLDSDDAVITPSEGVRLLAKAIEALAAKLDADGGVTDVDYEATVEAVSL